MRRPDEGWTVFPAHPEPFDVAGHDDAGDLEDAGLLLIHDGRVDIEAPARRVLPDPEVGEGSDAIVRLHERGDVLRRVAG